MPSYALPSTDPTTPSLHDALPILLSLDSRFDLAYNAAHAFSLAALRWHGYRSEHRYTVFQCLEHTVKLAAEQWRVLDQAHRQRNVRSEEHTSELQSLRHLVCRHMHCPQPTPPLLPYTTLFRSYSVSIVVSTLRTTQRTHSRSRPCVGMATDPNIATLCFSVSNTRSNLPPSNGESWTRLIGSEM